VSETIVHIEGPSIDGVLVPPGRGVEITAEHQDLNLYLQERHEIARPLRMVAYLTIFAKGRYHRGPPLYRGRVTGRQDGNAVDFDCATGEGVITTRDAL
jgi:hypothetical protein